MYGTPTLAYLIMQMGRLETELSTQKNEIHWPSPMQKRGEIPALITSAGWSTFVFFYNCPGENDHQPLAFDI